MAGAPEIQSQFSHGALLECVRRWGGHSLAYAILQPGMSYFGHPDTGVIAYRRQWGQAIVLGDPVCDPAHAAALLAAFTTSNRRCVFMQVSAVIAGVLSALGYYPTPVGVENEIEVGSFSLAGKQKRDLRHYRNKARKAGVEVREESDSFELRQRLRPVSDAWLPLKSWWARELELLARPFTTEPEPDVRIFTGSIGGQVVGFVLLDPMFQAGICQGYVVTLLRHTAAAPEGTVDYINLHVIERLAEEGIPVLSLGVSPFHRIEALAREHGLGLPLGFLGFLIMRHFGDPIYHFRGLSFHKSRYRATEVVTFTCLRPPIGVWQLVASARACRMI